jgi:hypothetical protein
VLYWVGRTPPDAGHLPVSHASSLRSFPSSCHGLKGISGTRDHSTCRPESSGCIAVYPCVCQVRGLKYPFRVAWICGCMYPPFWICLATYGRTYVPRTNSGVKAEMVRLISPNVRTYKRDFNIAGFFGLVSVDSGPWHCRLSVTVYSTYFQFVTYLDLISVISKWT